MTTENENINSDFWMGIVEDNSNDPLKLGQCRVRIIGTHSFDATELPTESLPWAIPTIPLNGSKSASVPNINDWVFGYFLDGKNKQMPIILGTMPGLINKTTYVKMTGAQQQEYLNKLNQQAKPIPKVEPDLKEGEPTVPPLARGEVANTSVSTTNNLRAHACDISFYIDKQIAEAKNFVKLIVSTIRKGIVAALKALGFSPGASALKSFVEDVRKTLKSINNFLNKVVKTIAEITEAIRKIRAVIDYILSLPARLLALFRDCLNQLYATLAATAFEIIVGGSLEGAADSPIDTGNLVEEVTGILNETKQILNNAATIYAAPYQIASALVTPSGQQLSDEEVKKIFEESYDGHSSFKQENYQPVLS